MLWVAVGLFMFAYVAIILVRMWRGTEAEHARESLGRVADPIEPEVLRRRLKDIARSHREIAVDTEGELIQISWNLDDEAAHARPHQASSQPTYRLQLQIDDHQKVVNVRYARGTILWEPGGDGNEGAPLEPSIDWLWPLEPVIVSEPPPAEAESESGDIRTRSVGHLVRVVRHCVLDAGYAWQPVLDITPGQGTRSPVAAQTR